MGMQWNTRWAETRPAATAAEGKVALWPPRDFTIEHRRVRRPAVRQEDAR